MNPQVEVLGGEPLAELFNVGGQGRGVEGFAVLGIARAAVVGDVDEGQGLAPQDGFLRCVAKCRVSLWGGR